MERRLSRCHGAEMTGLGLSLRVPRAPGFSVWNPKVPAPLQLAAFLHLALDTLPYSSIRLNHFFSTTAQGSPAHTSGDTFDQAPCRWTFRLLQHCPVIDSCSRTHMSLPQVVSLPPEVCLLEGGPWVHLTHTTLPSTWVGRQCPLLE